MTSAVDGVTYLKPICGRCPPQQEVEQGLETLEEAADADETGWYKRTG
jgi:hypothetical protein